MQAAPPAASSSATRRGAQEGHGGRGEGHDPHPVGLGRALGDVAGSVDDRPGDGEHRRVEVHARPPQGGQTISHLTAWRSAPDRSMWTLSTTAGDLPAAASRT